jgi:DNA replication factor GINS
MDLDELRAVQAGERSTDSLQSLRDSFYRDVAEYIDGLREERARAAERADDPFGSEEVRHLTDEIETAQEVAEAIYDRRLGKVVKRASLAAAGMPTDEDGLTDEETELFAAVVEEIESRRGAVLSAFAGENETTTIDPDGASGADHEDAGTPAATPGDRQHTSPPDADGERSGKTGHGDADGAGDRVDPDPVAREADADVAPDPDRGAPTPTGTDTTPNVDGTDAGFDASEAMSGEPVTETTPERTPGSDRSEDADTDRRRETEEATPDGGHLAAERATVRITRDVGEIMGVDEHVYDLADGDVVTLPSANAEPLLSRDAASRIE